MSRLTSWLRPGSALHRLFLEPESPELAIEVRETSLGLVRVRQEKGQAVLVSAAALDLPAGCVSSILGGPSLLDLPGFAAALDSLLERAGAVGPARAALILPDLVGRLRLFPRDEVKGRSRAETEELVRFRLKKAIPFEPREAQVAVAWPPESASEALVAVMARAGLRPYEELLRSRALSVGRVELASLALLRALAGRRGEQLLVNRDEGYVSFVATRDGWPRLVRTLSGASVPDGASAIREARATLSFAEERLGLKPDAIVLRDASGEPESFAAGLLALTGMSPEILGGPSSLPAAAGASIAAAFQSLGGPAS